jgi:hypothetical protein
MNLVKVNGVSFANCSDNLAIACDDPCHTDCRSKATYIYVPSGSNDLPKHACKKCFEVMFSLKN